MPPVNVITPSGRTIAVDESQVPLLEQQGYRRQAPLEEHAAGVERADEERYGEGLANVRAGLEGVARGVTLGASDWALRGLGVDPEGLRERKERNPVIATGGEIVGAVAPALVSGGAGALGTAARLTPAGAAARLGSRIATSGGGGYGRAALGMGIEGALAGAGVAASQLALESDPGTFEDAMSTLSSNALLGAGVGAFGGVFGKAAEKGIARAKRAVDSAVEKYGAGGAMVTDDLLSMDKNALRLEKEKEVQALREAVVPQRAKVAEEVVQLRVDAKARKPWIALEGFKAETKAPRVAKPSAPTTRVRRVSIDAPTGSAGGEFEIHSTDHVSSRASWDDLRRGRAVGAPDGSDVVTTVRIVEKTRVPSAARDEGGKFLKKGEDVVEREMARAQFAREGDDIVLRGWKVPPKRGERGRFIKQDESAIPQEIRDQVFAEAERRTGRKIPTWTAAREAEARAAAQAQAMAIPADMAREVREIGKLLMDADVQLDRVLSNPIMLAERPWAATAALQKSDHALTRLQAIAPELRARMALDPASSGLREEALDAIPDALSRNRNVRVNIESVTPEGQGGIWVPSSDRLKQIRAAEDILSQPASLGALQGLLATAAATAGGPGAAAATRAGGWVFGRLRKAATVARARGLAATSKLLGASSSAVRVTPPLATRVLSRVRFGPDTDDRARAPVPRDPASRLAHVYQARERELLDQVAMGPGGTYVMRPDARERVAAQLSGVRVLSPVLADRMETHAVARVEYLAKHLPRRPDMGAMQLGPSPWQPSEREMRSYARRVSAIEDPAGVEERAAAGLITPEEADAYRTIYPERLAQLTRRVAEEAMSMKRPLPWGSRLALTMLTGVPMDPALTPPVLRQMQGVYVDEPGTEGGTQAPTAQPQFGSVTREQPTPSQARQERRAGL